MVVVTCQMKQCKYNYLGMCGSRDVNITANGICSMLINRNGTPRDPREWVSDQKEKYFEVEEFEEKEEEE